MDPDDPVSDPAQVQAALDVVARWLCAGGTIELRLPEPSPGAPPEADSGEPHVPGPGTAPEPDHADPDDTTAIRAWARDEGLPVADRGRLSAAVVRRFRDAHPGS
jgi:hypothetical protein